MGGGLTGPILLSKLGNGGPHAKKKKTKHFFFLLIMIHLQMIISPSFLIRFGCFWARWKALDEYNLALIPLMGSEVDNFPKF